MYITAVLLEFSDSILFMRNEGPQIDGTTQKSRTKKNLTMVKKSMGIGAVCRVMMKYLHPSQNIRDKYPNHTSSEKLGELIVIRQEVKKVNRKDQMCIVMRHDSWPNQEMYCVKKWAKIIQEGDPASFFDQVAPRQEAETQVLPTATNDDTDEIPEQVFQSRGSNHEDISFVRSLGLGVDDDNDPAPENIPNGASINTEQSWGWDGVDPRQAGQFFDHGARLNHGLDEIPCDPMPITLVHLFLTLFPRKYLEEVILKKTNETIEDEIGEITIGELLRFLGIWFFLATTSGFARREFFSTYAVNVRTGAPYRVNQYMSRTRFEAILQALSYTASEPPPFLDRFWEVRELINQWNSNMERVFKSAWVCCLDESMSTWMSRWTCPGWMFVPRKPRPFGNEYHTICCGKSGILFAMELVEGKDRPSQLPSTPPNKKTTQLLLNLCKSLYGSGKVVVLDSGFCVLEALIALKKVGVFSHAVIKKRRYWPKYVPGDEINAHMEEKKIGDVACLKGELKSERYNLFVMKEPDYNMKLMATYGSLTYHPNEQMNTRVVTEGKVKFKYTKPFADHFCYRHAVDDHNNLRHSSPSLEDTWTTHRWQNRVFAFLLAVTEVNLYLYLRYTIWRDQSERPTLHQFRKRLAFALIFNRWIVSEEVDEKMTRSRTSKHEIRTAPVHAKKYFLGKWDQSAKNRYQSYVCRKVGCKAQVRTYCSCSPGNWLCKCCFSEHICQVISSDSSSY